MSLIQFGFRQNRRFVLQRMKEFESCQPKTSETNIEYGNISKGKTPTCKDSMMCAGISYVPRTVLTII